MMEKNNDGNNERVTVFIDLENVMKHAEGFGKDITTDFGEMVKALVGERELVRTYVFDGRRYGNSARCAVHCALRDRGFRVMTRNCYEKETETQKEVDVAMACEILSQAYKDEYDTAIIVSGDRDFRPAVEQIRSLGKRAEIAGFSASTSKVLSRRCDVFRNMDQIPMFCLAPETVRYYEEFVSEYFAMPFEAAAA